MKHTKKAPKTKRNQPLSFDESIAAPIPMSINSTIRPHLTLRQIRLALSVVWVGAALIAGVGIGRMINDAKQAPFVAEPPAPIATARVSATATVSGSIAQAQLIPVPEMKVAPAKSITQAQVGSAIATLSIMKFQPANTSDSLQPGYSSLVRAQGNIGTLPVR